MKLLDETDNLARPWASDAPRVPSVRFQGDVLFSGGGTFPGRVDSAQCGADWRVAALSKFYNLKTNEDDGECSWEVDSAETKLVSLQRGTLVRLREEGETSLDESTVGAIAACARSRKESTVADSLAAVASFQARRAREMRDGGAESTVLRTSWEPWGPRPIIGSAATVVSPRGNSSGRIVWSGHVCKGLLEGGARWEAAIEVSASGPWSQPASGTAGSTPHALVVYPAAPKARFVEPNTLVGGSRPPLPERFVLVWSLARDGKRVDVAMAEGPIGRGMCELLMVHDGKRWQELTPACVPAD